MATANPAAVRLSEAERWLSWVRFPIIVVNTIVYGVSGPAREATPWLAEVIIVAALIYGIVTLFRDPFQRLRPIVAAWATTLFDFGFIMVWIYATGGFHSPFQHLFFVAIASVALRFSPVATVVGAAAYGVSYLGLLVGMGQLERNLVEALLRVSYFGFVAAVSAFIAQQYFDEARAKGEMREEMRLVQRAEEKFRSLLEAAPDPIVITDDGGAITLVNAQAEGLFGQTRDRLLGAPISSLLAADTTNLTALTPKRGRKTAEVVARDAAGQAIPMEVTSSAVSLGSDALVIHVLRDLRERKLAEVERHRAVERQAEVERLREMDAFRTKFINMAAHELGTPLTPIRMQIHILKRADMTRLSPEQIKSIQVLDRNVERLRILTQDVLDVARIQAASLGLDRKSIDLNRLVLEAVESYAEAAHVSGLHLEARIHGACSLEADPKRLMQVLFNLIGNAIKFTPRGGHVQVRTERRANDVLLMVEDDGTGLTLEDASLLFRPFSQVGAMKDRKTGSGLGLYICKGIVESHGGTIAVASPGPGRGTVFTVRIPVTPPQGPDVPTPKPTTTPRPIDSIQGRVRELI
ncbi:MAG TPA: PAS domain-containing sensor histidine kinase [Candidatus Thermoplasmatota archaeon]|nr:PAS domain-containing sensor histidine kinase [Candidatus Thermoplasmatota archaeon]